MELKVKLPRKRKKVFTKKFGSRVYNQIRLIGQRAVDGCKDNHLYSDDYKTFYAPLEKKDGTFIRFIKY